MKFFNGILETPDEAVRRIDDIGGPHSHANYPWGWAQAGNTPFKWYKQNTHEGGVHVPLIVHWPERDRRWQRGSARPVPLRGRRRAHDLRAASASTPPAVHRGLEQMPVTGTFASPSTLGRRPTRRATKRLQYFEMVGHRGHRRRRVEGGLHAPGRVPITTTNRGSCTTSRSTVPSAHDLAAEAEPERLRDLVDRWWAEADGTGSCRSTIA